MKSTIKKIVDLAMMVIIVILMAYFITGREFHEYIGTAMLALFIEHTILNYKWYKAMFKGKISLTFLNSVCYNTVRNGWLMLKYA